MVESRFLVYELVILFSLSFSLILLGMFIFLIEIKDDKILLYIFSILCGFTIYLRPTLVLLGASLFTFLMAKLTSLRRESYVKSCMLFLLVVLSCLFLNFIRFGSVFEFGHNLNITMTPWQENILKFKDQAVPASVVKKGLSFFKCLTSQYFGGTHNCGINTYELKKIEEIYFMPFSILYFFLILVAISYFFATIKKIVDETSHYFLIGLFNFIILFVFYMNYDGFTSRYGLDFLPSVILCFYFILSVIDKASFTNQLKLQMFLKISFYVFILSIVYFFAYERLNYKGFERQSLRWAQEKVFFDHYRKSKLEFSKFSYRAEDASLRNCQNDKLYKLGYTDLSGWNAKTCLVEETTSFYIRAKSCYSLSIKGDENKLQILISNVRLKFGLQAYILKDFSYDKNVNIGVGSFCTDTMIREGVGTLFISWGSLNSNFYKDLVLLAVE